MYDEILFAIIEYINELPQRGTFWNRELFEQHVYSKWAALEIYYLLSKNEDKYPEQLVEDFAKKMDNYACMRKETSRIFSIAYDTAIDILDNVFFMEI